MASSSTILLSTAYLPPVQYIGKFLAADTIYIEKHENFQKQSYRNRCYIYGANGRQCLVIPVKKTHGEKTPIAEVEIDYQKAWQKIHLKSIQSAYHTSPFYEYYADDFNIFFQERIVHLFEWNFQLLYYILRTLNMTVNVKVTHAYEKKPADYNDLRQSIHPKKRLHKTDKYFACIPYVQVFQERYGFIPNLSIIDLLFNEGPNARNVLKMNNEQ
jgi:hypothetical protein